MNITKLFRPEIKKIKPYISSPTIDDIAKEIGVSKEKIIKADSGENPYVPDFGRLGEIKSPKVCYYPDPSCRKLRNKLSEYLKVSEEKITCGNGSDELIDLLIRIFVSKNDEIIINPPTFSMYKFYGELVGANIKEVLRNKNSLRVDIEKMLMNISDRTKMVFIDSPGNPTSTLIDKGEIERLLRRQAIVVVDEAYYEYCGKSAISLLLKYPNLVILRTFSKWAGLAGLRIGYAVACPLIINTIDSIRPPYNVNSFAQEAASSVLDNKELYLNRLKKIISLREKCVSYLSSFSDLFVYPSRGAYILIKPKTNAKTLQTYLRKEGILVKLIKSCFLENTLRMNLPGPSEMKRIISVLEKYYEN
ncbi:histidinol-phosphate transaminase [Patescibacteria group bacterium]|nr:histidinol-phosphate transaminase [Patescibacteria group bacterium]